jgi:hypothetical protein
MNSFDPPVANRYPLLSVKSQVVPETSGDTSQAVTTYCESPVTPNEGVGSAAAAAVKPAQTITKAPMTPGRPPIASPFCDVGLYRFQKRGGHFLAASRSHFRGRRAASAASR